MRDRCESTSTDRFSQQIKTKYWIPNTEYQPLQKHIKDTKDQKIMIVCWFFDSRLLWAKIRQELGSASWSASFSLLRFTPLALSFFIIIICLYYWLRCILRTVWQNSTKKEMNQQTNITIVYTASIVRQPVRAFLFL